MNHTGPFLAVAVIHSPGNGPPQWLGQTFFLRPVGRIPSEVPNLSPSCPAMRTSLQGSRFRVYSLGSREAKSETLSRRLGRRAEGNRTIPRSEIPFLFPASAWAPSHVHGAFVMKVAQQCRVLRQAELADGSADQELAPDEAPVKR